MVYYTDLKNALTKVVKTVLQKKHDYLAKTYYSYLRILENEKILIPISEDWLEG